MDSILRVRRNPPYQPVFTAARSSTAEVDECIEVGRRARTYQKPAGGETFTASAQARCLIELG